MIFSEALASANSGNLFPASSKKLTSTNLGPNKTDYIKNGGTTLNKADAGRQVAIVPDPTNADVLYVVWKTTKAI